jgi:mono/diheme cytochrome c family protein
MGPARRWFALLAALVCVACSDSTAPPEATPAASPAPPAEPAPPPAPPPAQAAPGAAASSVGDAQRGKGSFETYCVTCHGPRGEADGPMGLTLNPRPARLGDRAYMRDKTDDYLFQVIKFGGASVGRSPLMAPWGGALSDAQIRDVIAYVRSLAH